MRDAFLCLTPLFAGNNMARGDFVVHKADVYLSTFLYGMILFLVCSVISGAVYSNRVHGVISSEVLRLHVLAHSDSPEDQFNKFMVKLAILNEMDLQRNRDIEAGELELIERTAAEISGYPAAAALTREFFPTRMYGGITLPAGIYDTVQVTIGDAAGRNWWCVVFPPLCFLEGIEVQKPEELFSDETYEIISDTETIRFKFKTVEIWQGIKNFFINK